MAFTLAFCAGCASPTGPDSDNFATRISGQIWGQVLQGQANPAGSFAADTYANPVAGAVVSTSLDSVTATSDASGNFMLRTNTKSSGPFTLRITAAGYPTYERAGCWGATGNGHKIGLTWSLADPIAAIPC